MCRRSYNSKISTLLQNPVIRKLSLITGDEKVRTIKDEHNRNKILNAIKMINGPDEVIF